MKIVVIGGTSAIAEHCCRLWVEQAAVDLTLVVRDTAKAERIAADLRVRGPKSSIAVVEGEFFDPAGIDKLVASIAAAGPIDIALIAHGWLSDQLPCQDDLAVCRQSLEVNAVSPALFAEAFAARFAKAGRGTLAIIGSVAGDRGRKANYTYGAAKGFIARYAEGMEHRFAGTGVKIVLIKPGPTDTPMAAAFKAQGRRLASVESVAEVTVKAIRRGRPVVYAPAIWQAIMLIVRHMPRFVFNRLSI
ncbi:MAG: SDR family NAD(P)-dependent oxidoreductase [Reyranellales bacterium]